MTRVALLLAALAVIAYLRRKPEPLPGTGWREDDDGIAPLDPYLNAQLPSVSWSDNLNANGWTIS